MSRYVLFLTFALLLAGTGFAQFKISGKVVNDQGQPVGFSEVVLFQQGSDKVAAGAATKDDGAFALQAPQGAYRFQVRIFGQAAFEKTLDLTADTDLGTIAINDKTALEEVTVTDQKKLIERKVDRVVFNVENSVLSTGSDALEALKRTPRILVKDKGLEMIGKGAIVVMMDDRLLRLSGDELILFLKSLGTDQIKSIEVISNPPAKYSAEGNAGMINIISKKTKFDEWNASVDSGYQQRTYPIGYTSLSYNLKYKNLSLSSSLRLHKGSSGPWSKRAVYYPDQLWQTDFTRENYFGNVVPKIALDYKISEKFSTGVSYNFRFGNYGDRNARTTDEVSNLQTRANDFTIRTLASRDEKNYTHIGNYHLIFKPDTIGKKLTLDFDWFKHDHNQVQPFKSDRYLRGGQDFDQTLQAVDNQGYRNTNNYSVNLDMEHPTKWVNLNYGGRLSFVDIDSGFNAYDIQTPERILDESRSNVFLFKENTQALYASAQKTIGKKWEAKVGLRLESTQIEGYSRTLDQRTPINYTKLFPTAYVSYTPKENHNLSLNYGRRISRPDFDSYNPFRWTFSSFSYWEGNPFLLPSFTHNVEFTYSYKSLLTSTVYFSRTEDGFGGISIVDPVTKINKFQPLNYYASNQFGVRQSANIDITKQIQLNLSADGVYIESRAFVPITLQRIGGWIGYFSANVDITLNSKKTLFLNLYGQLVTDGVDDGLLYLRSYGTLDASFKALLFNKKLTVLLSGGDLLRTSIYRMAGYSNNQRVLNTFYGDARYVGLSLTYTFGKAFNLNTHEQKNKDELNRIN